MRNSGKFTNLNTIKALYTTLVRTKLEYASLIWYPCYNNHINSVERVQRRFLKYVAYKIDGIYPIRGSDPLVLTRRFELPMLASRRFICSQIFLFKLINNLVDSPALLSQLNFFVPRVNSRQTITFRTKLAKTNLLKKSPIHTISLNFNRISSDCDLFSCSLGSLLAACQLFLDL